MTKFIFSANSVTSVRMMIISQDKPTSYEIAANQNGDQVVDDVIAKCVNDCMMSDNCIVRVMMKCKMLNFDVHERNSKEFVGCLVHTLALVVGKHCKMSSALRISRIWCNFQVYVCCIMEM